MFGVDQIAVYLKIHAIYTLQYDYLVGCICMPIRTRAVVRPARESGGAVSHSVLAHVGHVRTVGDGGAAQ
jgi:hypothetical protein